MNCSKRNIAVTWDNYKKARTVCKFCYNNHVLAYYKNRFCPNSSPKPDISTQKELSIKQDGSDKQESSNKRDRSRKQISSSKRTSFIVKGVDPEIFFKSFGELFDTPYYKDNDARLACDEAFIILKEVIRTKHLTRKKYNHLMSKWYIRE